MTAYNNNGLKVIEQVIQPNTSVTFNFYTPNLMNATIRFENSSLVPQTTVLQITTINYKDNTPIIITLTPDRYGVYFNQKPMESITFTNTSSSVGIEIYFEYLVTQYLEPYNEIMQFITNISIVPVPNITTLFQGANNRYTGSLTNATFLSDMPLGTPVAVRQINLESTSATATGSITIPLANNLDFHDNVSPLGATINSTIASFNSDTITNQLPSSATLTDIAVNYIIIDFLFNYNITISQGGYTLQTTGSTTNIVYSGTVYAYYFNNTSSYFSNAAISSITSSNSAYTVNPTSGVTNTSGNLIFNYTQQLNSTSNLSTTLSASATISNITRTASSSTATSPFNFNINTTYSSTVISTNTTLTADLISGGDITINSGVTLTTNGYSIICGGTFTNSGTINTGVSPFTGGNESNSGTSITTSYGGSGGGGGAGEQATGAAVAGGNGGSTVSTGGSGGFVSNGGSGSTPTPPTITNTLINTWYTNTMYNYLSGAGGGGGALLSTPASSGQYGLYIQAQTINAGIINTNSSNGTNGFNSGGNSFGGTGAGGAGSLLLAYSSSYNAGTYNVNGGTGGIGAGGNSYSGGNGGNGNVITYIYTTQPISTGTNLTTNIKTTQSTAENIPNQTITWTATNCTVTPTSAITNTSGNATATVTNVSTNAKIVSSSTIATITNSVTTNLN